MIFPCTFLFWTCFFLFWTRFFKRCKKQSGYTTLIILIFPITILFWTWNLFLLILNLVFQKKPLIFLRVPFFFFKKPYWLSTGSDLAPLNCTNEFSHALKHAVVSHETLADHVSLTGPADMTSRRFEVFFVFSVLLCVNVLLRKVCMKRPRKGTWRECGGWNNEDCGSTSRKEGNRIESWENSVEFKGWRVYIVYYIFVILHCRFVIELPIFARTIANHRITKLTSSHLGIWPLQRGLFPSQSLISWLVKVRYINIYCPPSGWGVCKESAPWM